MSDVDILYNAVRNRAPSVSLQTMRSFDRLLEEVYKRDPRLTGWVNSYQGTKQGMLVKSLEIMLTYDEKLPEKIEDIMVDEDQQWRPSDMMSHPENPPRRMWVVTNDAEAWKTRINEEHERLGVVCPGYAGYEWQMQQEPSANGYSLAFLELKYIYDQPTYEMYWLQAERKMKSICQKFFGDETVHKIVKTFLAFSYLQQHCEYDDQAYECIKKNEMDKVQRPWVQLPFGPIERNMGICCGIAYALQMFLNHFGIPNMIINGELGEGDDHKLHAWNLVKFNEKYYHIDATAGVSGSSVYVGAFMKTDREMRVTYKWDAAKFPAAEGKQFDFDFIESYIENHEDELLDAGVDERYLFPDDVRE